MTVISYSARQARFATFFGRARQHGGEAAKTEPGLDQWQLINFFLLLSASAFLAASIGLGLHSIILSFRMYGMQSQEKILRDASSAMQVKLLQKSNPNVLASEASMLELKDKGVIHYLVIEPRTLADSGTNNIH